MSKELLVSAAVLAAGIFFICLGFYYLGVVGDLLFCLGFVTTVGASAFLLALLYVRFAK